jgi:hypothetical protein
MNKGTFLHGRPGIPPLDQVGLKYRVGLIRQQFGGSHRSVFRGETIDLSGWHVLHFDQRVDVLSVVSEYKQIPGVLDAQPVSLHPVYAYPNDEFYSYQWHLLKIERCAGSGCPDFVEIATVGINVTGYSDTGLSVSTSYSYRVRAYNSAYDSGYSNTASATTLAAVTPPAAPSNLRATAFSKSQINLTWTDNASNQNGFEIERCKGSKCTNFARVATVGSNVTSYSDTDLSKNTTYRYRARAYNGAEVSVYSNITSAKTPR